MDKVREAKGQSVGAFRSFLATVADTPINQLVIYIALPVWLASEILLNTNAIRLLPFQLISNISLAAMLFGEFFFTKHNIRSAIAFLLICVFAYVLNVADQGYIGRLVLICYCVRNLDCDKLLRICLVVEAVVLVQVVWFCLLDVIADVAYTAGRGLRHGLGYSYPTFLSHYYLNFILMYAYVRRRRIGWLEIVALIAVTLFIYYETGSRNSFLLSLLVLAVLVIWKIRAFRVPGFLKHGLLGYSFLICAVVAIVLFLGFDWQAFPGSKINSLLSNRLYLVQTTMATYGLSLFGQPIDWATYGLIHAGLYLPYEYLYIDSSYISVLICAGVVPFAIIIVWLTAVTRTAVNEKGALLGFIFLVYAIHDIVDPQMLELSYCCFLLFMGPVISKLTQEKTDPPECLTLRKLGPYAKKGASIILLFAIIGLGVGFLYGQHQPPSYTASHAGKVSNIHGYDAMSDEIGSMASTNRFRAIIGEIVGEDAVNNCSIASSINQDTGEMVVTVIGSNPDDVIRVLDTSMNIIPALAVRSTLYSYESYPDSTGVQKVSASPRKWIAPSMVAGIALVVGITGLYVLYFPTGLRRRKKPDVRGE